MTKTGFAAAIVGTASLKVEVDANGNLVTDSSGVVSAGTKRISFNTINADATKNDIETVTTVFLETLPGVDSTVSPYSNETTFSVKWESE